MVLSESYIGKDKNVKMTSLSCTIKGDSKRDTLVKRQAPPLDVCGANCKEKAPLRLYFDVSYGLRRHQLLLTCWRWPRPKRMPCNRRCPSI